MTFGFANGAHNVAQGVIDRRINLVTDKAFIAGHKRIFARAVNVPLVGVEQGNDLLFDRFFRDRHFRNPELLLGI
jgi:hypothetical protein